MGQITKIYKSTIANYIHLKNIYQIYRIRKYKLKFKFQALFTIQIVAKQQIYIYIYLIFIYVIVDVYIYNNIQSKVSWEL